MPPSHPASLLLLQSSPPPHLPGRLHQVLTQVVRLVTTTMAIQAVPSNSCPPPTLLSAWWRQFSAYWEVELLSSRYHLPKDGHCGDVLWNLFYACHSLYQLVTIGSF
jgi:hypothetical protein